MRRALRFKYTIGAAIFYIVLFAVVMTFFCDAAGAQVKDFVGKPVKGAFLRLTDANKWYVPGLDSWVVAHSFFDGVKDAKEHYLGTNRYFKGKEDWHTYKALRDISLIMASLNMARSIFIDKMSYKDFTKSALRAALIRALVFGVVYKTAKAGFPAYNDPFFNRHSIYYPTVRGGRIVDGYIGTGRFTTISVDLLKLAGIWKLR